MFLPIKLKGADVKQIYIIINFEVFSFIKFKWLEINHRYIGIFLNCKCKYPFKLFKLKFYL